MLSNIIEFFSPERNITDKETNLINECVTRYMMYRFGSQYGRQDFIGLKESGALRLNKKESILRVISLIEIKNGFTPNFLNLKERIFKLNKSQLKFIISKVANFNAAHYEELLQNVENSNK